MTKLLDSATGAVFFQKELEYLKQATYDVKYADIRYRSFFPVSNEAPSWADSIAYQTFDQAGAAKIVHDHALDFPRVDLAAKEETAAIHTIGSSFAYTLDELNKSNATGKRLPERKALAARRAIEQKLNSIAWYGDTAAGLGGLQTDSNVPRQNAADLGSGTAWSVKTPDQILADFIAAFEAIIGDSKGVHATNFRAVAPLGQYTDLATRRMTDTGMTVLQYIAQNCPFIANESQITWANELDAFGTAAVDDLWVYQVDPMNLEFEISQEVMVHDDMMKIEGLEYSVPVSARTAGLLIHYPLSMILIEGI